MRVTGLLCIGIAAMTLFVSACSGTAQPATSAAVSLSPVASPSPTPSASPTPTASPSPVASPSASCPTGSAGQQVICPTTGEAHAKLTGAIMLSFSGAIMTPPIYRPLITLPAGPVTLAYRTGSDEIFLQLATAGPGTIKTGGASFFNFNVGGGVFGSSHGECSIVVKQASATSFSGSFSCKGVPPRLGLGPIDATGTFNAGP